jgi:hypothetical protein
MQLLFTVSPRKPVLWTSKDFRPLSLVGGVYKIISKILAYWLKTVLDLLFLVPRMRSSKEEKFWI